MARGLLELSLSKALTKASRDRVGDGQAAWGNLGFKQGRCQSLIEDLADGPSPYSSGVVFPVDEGALSGCCCGSVLPQLFTLGGSLMEFLVRRLSSFEEDRNQGLFSVTSVQEVSEEGFGVRPKVCKLAVLNPKSLESSEDQAFEDAFGVCGAWGDVQV